MARSPKPSGRSGSRPRLRARGRNRVERKVRFLIVTEGLITEPIYFDRLAKYTDASLVIRPRGRASGASSWDPSPLEVVRKCVALRQADLERNGGANSDVEPFARCFAVVDVDHRAHRAGGRAGSVLEEASKLAEEEGIVLIVSNTQFEVWLLWHVEEFISFPASDVHDRCIKRQIFRDKHAKALSTSFPVEAFGVASERALKSNALPPGCIGSYPASSMPALLAAIGVKKPA